MEKTFRPWEVDQVWLFPPSVRDLVPDGDLAHVVRDLVRDELDLSAIHATYTELRGQPPYHPTMMTALLLYCCCRGIYSSRKIEGACRERVDVMAVTAMATPDHDTIATFRRRHRDALGGLFAQVLVLCREAGIVRMGHVALDGTKVKANASKHRAMSYARMSKAEHEIEEVVRQWFDEAERVDAEEDALYGKGRRGDEMPDWARTKAGRLKRIREAKARIEARAKEEAERVKAQREAKEKERGKPLSGPKPRALEGQPDPKSQSNFTDPDSRILRVGGTYEQAYNCQAAVDAERQVIVSQHVVARQNDHEELGPTLAQIEEVLGELPRELSADSGYCSEDNLALLEDRGVRAYVATGRQKHGTRTPTSGDTRGHGSLTQAMRTRLRRGGWRSRYRLRKHTVEPVFGQIKACRGWTQFLHRGIESVRAEWTLICTAHNLLKLAAARA